MTPSLRSLFEGTVEPLLDLRFRDLLAEKEQEVRIALIELEGPVIDDKTTRIKLLPSPRLLRRLPPPPLPPPPPPRRVPRLRRPRRCPSPRPCPRRRACSTAPPG